MNHLSQCEIIERLSDLDEETMIHDPMTVEGSEALAHIRGEMEELESILSELAHMEWQEHLWG
jgi:hypothetical protein